MRHLEAADAPEAARHVALPGRSGGLDDEALQAFHDLTRSEGIIPALETSHALAYASKLAATMTADESILVNLSGRGDKDMHTVASLAGLKV